MNRTERLSLYADLRKPLSEYSDADIEDGIMTYCLSSMGLSSDKYETGVAKKIAQILEMQSMPTDLESIVEFFEFLLDDNNKGENGIVFTPKYIADYIVATTLKEQIDWNPSISIIDPGCGGGIFLIAAAEFLHKKYHVKIETIIENNLFGIDIDSDNVRRCSLAMKLLCAKYGGDFDSTNANILCLDSLKSDWKESFSVSSFDYVIGNPPYVNPHDMNTETTLFLKKTFSTTQNGVFNIFYAFIEHAIKFLSSTGALGYIVPNNFLTIKSALDLRDFLQSRKYIKSILDFGDNMVFRPVRTYNCIIILSKKINESFDYTVMEGCDDVEKALPHLQFFSMPTEVLDKNGWKLVNEHTRINLNRIETQCISIKEFIRTGIATLRDGVYIVDCDADGFYKTIDGKKYYIESGLVKPIYKIPDLKLYDNVCEAERHIIFPYIRSKQGYVLIPEVELAEKYPLTYNVLLLCKDELDSRDKGKGNAQGWFAYGRTQGLNKYGRKLLFPTFSNRPKFLYVDNEDALFCNGYAVFENNRIDLEVLARILNSKVMSYYVSNTSYSIEGGYYCYQKKYIERFSIPLLSEDDVSFIQRATTDELDDFLWRAYGLD
ncbi:MAG: N-6 DNA methylase [Eubacteriales bacterium]|nr:N-6 DNA methylase [Eubacteriales bacterium]